MWHDSFDHEPFDIESRCGPQPRLTWCAARDLSFASLIFFARPFFVSSATAREVPDDELAVLRRQAAAHRSIYLYSVVTAFLLVAAGPALTALRDISSALLVVLPVLYANAIIALADVIAVRRELGLSRKALLSLAFEFIVCPVLVTNLNKRLLDRSIVPNTLQLVGADQALQHRIKANLEFHELPVPQMRPTRMVSSEVLVTVLAGIIGFIVIWYLMGLITEKFSTGPAPTPQSRPNGPTC